MKTETSKSTIRKQIPRIEIDLNHIDYDLVKKVSKNYTQPVVFSNLLVHAPRQLDIDYLEELCGNRMIEVIKDGTLSQDFHKVEMITMTFNEFAQRIQRNEPLYLNNVSAIFDDNNQLRKDLMISEITRLFTMHNPNPIAQIFIGPQGTRTDLHCAMTPNLFYNAYGQKKWAFISPKYTHLINSNLAQSGVYAVSNYSMYSNDLPEHFDFIEIFETTLQSGDVLFNPAFWWHSVSNESSYTIGVATRLFDGTVGTALHSFKQNCLFSFESIFLTKPFGKIFSMNPKDTEKIILDGLRARKKGNVGNQKTM
ncbi:MAG: cupin-like domain-containing protein [Cyanobacteria bacterium P01_F01_bin.150]